MLLYCAIEKKKYYYYWIHDKRSFTVFHVLLLSNGRLEAFHFGPLQFIQFRPHIMADELKVPRNLTTLPDNTLLISLVIMLYDIALLMFLLF